jgi:hypothetical protein
MRLAVLLPLGVVVAGFVWIYTVGTLFGALLVLGGVLSLFVTTAPFLVERITTFLSTGTLWSRWWK